MNEKRFHLDIDFQQDHNPLVVIDTHQNDDSENWIEVSTPEGVRCFKQGDCSVSGDAFQRVADWTPDTEVIDEPETLRFWIQHDHNHHRKYGPSAMWRDDCGLSEGTTAAEALDVWARRGEDDGGRWVRNYRLVAKTETVRRLS